MLMETLMVNKETSKPTTRMVNSVNNGTLSILKTGQVNQEREN
jgi:hypothetical protein